MGSKDELCLIFSLPALPLALSGNAYATTTAYYRFENGPAGAATSIVDSSGNNLNGSIFSGSPTYNASIAVTQLAVTGQVNNFSLNLVSPDSASFNYPFPFQLLNNATLEFWINPSPSSGAWDFIWTTTIPGDANRFNIHWIGGQFAVDYREPNGAGHGLGATAAGAVPVGQWSFVAFVKQGNKYSIFVNGPATGNITTLESQVTDTNPNLPNNNTWTINGRCALTGQDCSGAGVLDEIRLSDQALNPPDFLVTNPFPVTIAIAPPTAAPVQISLSSTSLTPVAILSTPSFTATQVDPTSIRFGGAPAVLSATGKPQCRSVDVNGDGLSDLLCQIVTQQIQLQPGNQLAVLTGRLKTGTGQLIGGGEAVIVTP